MKRMLCLLLFFLCFVSVLSVSAAQNVVSLHKAYELVTPASEGYPDESDELTNGKYGTPVANGDTSYYYRDTEYVGFNRQNVNGDGNFVVVLDLAEDYAELSDFEVSYLIETDVGISAPKKASFYISKERNGDYTFIGEAAVPESDSTQQQKAAILTVSAEEAVSGRYVMCVITPSEYATWTFIDEITVLQGRNAVSDDPSAESSSIENSANTDTPSAESSREESRPAAGDGGVLTLAVLSGASALGAAALIGRRRRRY